MEPNINQTPKDVVGCQIIGFLNQLTSPWSIFGLFKLGKNVASIEEEIRAAFPGCDTE